MTLATEPFRRLPPGAARQGRTPAVLLVDPRFARNVGTAVRAASCYGARQVWFTGERVGFDLAGRGRLPREERMKGYRDVEVLHSDRPFDQLGDDVVPVAVEVRERAEALFDFVHPDKAVYVFGPEDGSLPRAVLRHCHRFVIIPSRHCLNLAVSVATVLYDRQLKRALLGDAAARVTPGEWEQRCGARDASAETVDAWLLADG